MFINKLLFHCIFCILSPMGSYKLSVWTNIHSSSFKICEKCCGEKKIFRFKKRNAEKINMA